MKKTINSTIKSTKKNIKTKKVVATDTENSCTDNQKKQSSLAIIGVCKNSDKKAFNNIRNDLKKLYVAENTINIIDLGNIEFDEKKIKKIIADISEQKNNTIFFCENDEISANILALCRTKESNIVLVLADATKENKHIAKLLDKQTNELSIIAYQNYFSDKNIITQFNKNHYTTIRLSEYRNDNNSIEPILRDSNFLSIDLAAVRYSDGGTQLSPNGLYAEELCQIANYAGLSNTVSQVNIVCNNSENGVTSQLIAQTVWHFIDGFANRIVETPSKNKFKKFIVTMENSSVNLIFYKSNITNRWWMEVSHNNKRKITACTFSDYQCACNNNIPAKWIKEMQKMS